MSRRCLICANLNPCATHTQQDQERELARNERAIAEIRERAVTPIPCPTCGQYSRSLGDDAITEAFNYFQSMYAQPVRGHPMAHVFDEKTRDAAQVLMAAARKEAVMTEPTQTDLVERVARAICCPIRPYCLENAKVKTCHWEEYDAEARAAIAAMPAPDLLAENARLREENERLSKQVVSGVLGELLNTEEHDALVDFIKFLRTDPSLRKALASEQKP